MPDTYEATWQDEWPTTPGLYWFYGLSAPSFRKEKPELLLVEVFKTADDSLMYVAGGICLRDEGAIGKWCLPILPELPNLEAERG